MFVNKVKAIPKINNFREICRVCLHECSNSFQLIQQEISIVKFLQNITNVEVSCSFRLNLYNFTIIINW